MELKARPRSGSLSGGFRYLDHTADVGIIATGKDLKEAFAWAALGLFTWIVDLDTVEEREMREIQVTSHDLDSLLVDWLNELNYLFEAHSFVFKRVQVVELGENRLKALGYGEGADPARHHFKGLVKAATYHMLQIQKRPKDWHLQVILDI